MKRTLSLLLNLLLSSTLFWNVPSLNAEVVDRQESIVKDPTDITGYCHVQFPPMREETLSWTQPVLNEAAGNIIDFYGPCDHDPTGKDEIEAQKRLLLRQYFDDSE
jgi:hypothetical protein